MSCSKTWKTTKAAQYAAQGALEPKTATVSWVQKTREQQAAHRP